MYETALQYNRVGGVVCNWWRTSTCSCFHSSRFTERTKEMCTPERNLDKSSQGAAPLIGWLIKSDQEMYAPRLRWMPEHLMQMKVPNVADAQRGPMGGFERGEKG